LNILIGGMVASPTPIVPISSDSITVIAHPWPTAADRAAAAIHPAEPPPTITILRSLRSGVCMDVSFGSTVFGTGCRACGIISSNKFYCNRLNFGPRSGHFAVQPRRGREGFIALPRGTLPRRRQSRLVAPSVYFLQRQSPAKKKFQKSL